MKMNDYNNVFNRIHPDEELENKIIEKCMNTESKKFRKKYFAPVVAVVMTICIGTVGVSAAMNYEWIKSLFEEDFVISEDIESLAAETSNYECWSNCGIKMSLDGVVADEQSIYCQFNIDEMPEGYNPENLILSRIDMKNFRWPDETLNLSSTFGGSINEDGKFIISSSWDNPYIKENDSVAIHIYNHEQFVNYCGDREISTIYDADTGEKMFYDVMTVENIEKYNNSYDNILIKFDIDFSDCKIPSVIIGENEVQHNGMYSGLIEDIEITPFKILCGVSATSPILEEGKIILENGDEVILESDIHSLVREVDENGTIQHEYMQIWEFNRPINPEKVAEIYIRNECIYTK